MVTWDEDDGKAGNNIYTALVGDTIPIGVVNSTTYTHYSTLRTIEENFYLDSLGKGDATANIFLPLFYPPPATPTPTPTPTPSPTPDPSPSPNPDPSPLPNPDPSPSPTPSPSVGSTTSSFPSPAHSPVSTTSTSNPIKVLPPANILTIVVVVLGFLVVVIAVGCVCYWRKKTKE